MSRISLEFLYARTGEKLTITKHTESGADPENEFVSGADPNTTTSSSDFYAMVSTIQSDEKSVDGYNAKIGDLMVDTVETTLDDHTKNRIHRNGIEYRILHKTLIDSPSVGERYRYFCRRDD